MGTNQTKTTDYAAALNRYRDAALASDTPTMHLNPLPIRSRRERNAK